MRQPLTQDEMASRLDGWEGRLVAVRVVAEGGELLAVFCGELAERSGEKGRSLFWPLLVSGQPAHVEVPGIYMHREQFGAAWGHVGDTVLEIRQRGVTLNLRRL